MPSETVLQFPSKTEAELSGPARCMECRHKWAAVAPAGTVILECPACSMMKGAWVGAIISERSDIWQCKCGNDLFAVYRIGIMCARCGLWHQPFD
jgi:hypothetical protein